MFEFELPDLGEGVAEGEVLEWHVAVGDTVTEDQVLAEVETDKAAVDVPSPVDGVVRELHAEAGDVVQTGELLVTIEEDGEREAAESGATETASEEASADETTTDAAPTVTTGDGRVFAAPSVRRLAREEGVDITAVEGSGPGGRVTEADVEAAAEAAENDDGPTSVVSKISDDEDDGPTSVVSRVGDDGESPTDDEAQAVKSAVRKVSAAEPMAERRERTLATPATRRLARELDVDIDAVPTDETRDGEPYVDEAAVRSFAEAEAAEVTDEDVREVTEAVVSEMQSIADEAAESTTAVEAAEGDRREPYRGVRRAIGEQMTRSRREVPHATHHDKVAVPGLVEARDRLQPLAEERGVHLTYTPFLLKCVAAALDDHPILASQLDAENEEIVYKADRNVGVAAATDHGLVVPVVEDVDEKGLLELATEVNDLVDRARSRDIAREEMQGGTFTVTNFGTIGGEYADPVINVPETAILGVGALKERPVAEDGEVVAKPTLTLSLAIDHRVIDGADAARFVNTLKEYLADPTRLLLE
ncbi:2-oxo acid dehydrogenase subunit E2 [Haloarcula pellucida]|uniref:Branched-chain alpha-keto acid dehydrogenase subunit E2 n=1 Tax=Haloarcula pellucida TaxID=1427151 RepID=A0A830GRW5_9EURY|nr:2-oxo acid dehydrogenase subunit E2 [Halomicroarcula pellucida]MBX0349621.1 2-oxo acid dehydrogenase subunit E2 [Halomicroarcula pellucida]GGO02034.1 branched-chain alpha-keto acid dehydrogenase subunit E2 [Halomicroarcula pellucida]